MVLKNDQRVNKLYITRRITKTKVIVIEAMDDWNVIGQVKLFPYKNSDYYWLDELEVVPINRGKGIGRELVSYAQNLAKKNNKGLLLEAKSEYPEFQEKLEKFYQDAGFEDVNGYWIWG